MTRSAWLATGLILCGCGVQGSLELDPEALAQARAAVDEAGQLLAAATDAQNQGNFEVLVQRRAEAEDRLVRARRLYETAQAPKSGDAALLREYAEIAEQTGDYDLAAEAYERSLRSAPSADTYLGLGRSLARLGPGRTADAISALEVAAAGKTPATAAQAYEELGAIYWESGLYGKAEASYRAALDRDSSLVRASLGLAAVELRNGDPLAASNRVESLVLRDTGIGTEVDAMLGEAMRDFDQLRNDFPEEHDQHLAFAKLAIRLNEPLQALLAAERAAALDDSEYVTWNLIGSIASQTGDVERAREAFERSLALEPDQARTREALEALSP